MVVFPTNNGMSADQAVAPVALEFAPADHGQDYGGGDGEQEAEEQQCEEKVERRGDDGREAFGIVLHRRGPAADRESGEAGFEVDAADDAPRVCGQDCVRPAQCPGRRVERTDRG